MVFLLVAAVECTFAEIIVARCGINNLFEQIYYESKSTG